MQGLVEHELAAGSLGDELDRPVVVRRPEPAGDEAQVGPRPSESAASSSSGRSPTIVILAGSRPSNSACAARNGPFRSVRSPRTSSLPGDDDRGARPLHGYVPGPAGTMSPEVTIRLRGFAPPTSTARPFSFIRTFSGEPM